LLFLVICLHSITSSAILTIRPTIFDRNVLALDVTNVGEALPESANVNRRLAGRSAAEESDHRHWLLRPRRKRPRSRRAAEQRDELTSS
jgi:hypothetical protein